MTPPTGDELVELVHDLKSTVAVIAGYAELLKTREDAEIRREGPERILEATARLNALADSLL